MTRALLALSLALPVALAPSPALCQVASVLTPAEAQSTFRAANDACLKDDFKACVDGYERLIAAGWGTSDVEYNLGTAHLKLNRLGPGILHLERALRLDPGDADARANLEKAQQKRVDKLVGAPEETGGEEPVATRIVSHTAGDLWSAAFLAFWSLGALATVLRRFVRAPGRRGALLAVGLGLLLLALPCFAVTLLHVYVRERAHDAVVVAASVPVHEGPQEGSKASFEIHEGLKVRVLDQEGAFRRVRLGNGLQGWVPASSVMEITPG
jgi:hypothetical protein